MNKSPEILKQDELENLYGVIKQILQEARQTAYRAVNFAMVTAYWQIGKIYRLFPIGDTLRPELSWSHYRRLLGVENEDARKWYMNEAAEQVWSTRQLDRQISTLYYERLQLSADKMDTASPKS